MSEIEEALKPIYAFIREQAGKHAMVALLEMALGEDPPDDMVASLFYTGLLFGCAVGVRDVAAARAILVWSEHEQGHPMPDSFDESVASLSAAALREASK